jgi:hypothetical protein
MQTYFDQLERVLFARIARGLPGTLKRAGAKHIRAIPAEVMPITGGKTQMIPYYCFHDVDVSPEGASLKEYLHNFAVMTEVLAEKRSWRSPPAWPPRQTPPDRGWSPPRRRSAGG